MGRNISLKFANSICVYINKNMYSIYRIYLPSFFFLLFYTKSYSSAKNMKNANNNKQRKEKNKF